MSTLAEEFKKLQKPGDEYFVNTRKATAPKAATINDAYVDKEAALYRFTIDDPSIESSRQCVIRFFNFWCWNQVNPLDNPLAVVMDAIRGAGSPTMNIRGKFNSKLQTFYTANTSLPKVHSGGTPIPSTLRPP